MFKKTALIAGIGLALAANAQADYRWEIDAAAGRTNIDIDEPPINDDGDVDRYALGGTFFLDNVDTSKGPLSEAAFLDHASSVSVMYVYTDLDDIVEDLDGDQYGISGRYVTEGAGWIVEASYDRQEPDFSDIDTYSIGAGKYLTENTTLVLTFANTDVDEGGDTDSYAATIEHLWSLSSGAIKLEGNIGQVDVDDGDDIDIYSVSGIWYINNNLGFGASYGSVDAGGFEADQYGIFSEWFINEQIALSAGYTYSEPDDTDIEIEAFAVGARLRF